ncbi:MAG TPA: cobalt ECF transporter T component CbiQ [Acidimicrobiia bacterium]|nr:cobalt ECF transporter T component CbiQ [Acidimicrobiia bacterium]
MSGSHVHALYRHGTSPLHHAAPQVKVVAAFGFVMAVVSTPRTAVWAFAVYGAIVVALLAFARLSLSFVARRALVLVPFLAVALLFPIIGSGERIDVLGLSLSVDGLWDLWNVAAKAGLGFLIAVVLGATTEITDLLRGLEALHMPRIVTSIIGFAVRYIDIVTSDFARMRIALASRGYRARSIAAWGVYARTIGAMFMRTYERGERVYLAMLSRVYRGTMPAIDGIPVPGAQWFAAAVFVGSAMAVMIMSRTMS